MDTTNFNLQLTKSQSSSRRLSTAVVGSQSHHRRPMMTEKPKASNFPFTSIAIGPSWRRVSRREGDMTAKLYFAKRKLIWEFLEGALKSKIEVQWSDITAIRALMPPNQPGALQIELGKTPSFFREMKPEPTKHTKWEQSSDFIDGHALIHRIHYVIFPHGELDKHYQKLLQYDQNMFELSQMAFPSRGVSPYFNTSFNNSTPLTSPSLNRVVSSDDQMRDDIGMASFHKASSFLNSTASGSGSGQQQLRVLPSQHMSYNLQELHFNGGGPCSTSSQFNQIQNNPNLYGVSHVDQEMMQIIAARDPINNNNAAAPINCLPPPGSNFYGGITVEQRPELIDNTNFFNFYGDVTVEQRPELIDNTNFFNFYGGVTVEQRPELIDNTNVAFEDSNFYGGVTVEQQPQLTNNINFCGGVTVEQPPELIDNNNFALNWMPPSTLKYSNFYGGVTVEQQPQLTNNINFCDGVTVEQRPELIENNNFALKWLPPPTLEDSNCAGSVTVEQQPLLNNNNNLVKRTNM